MVFEGDPQTAIGGQGADPAGVRNVSLSWPLMLWAAQAIPMAMAGWSAASLPAADSTRAAAESSTPAKSGLSVSARR